MDNNQSVFERISESNKSAQSNKSRLLIFILSIIPLGLHQYYLENYIKGIIQTAITLAFVLFIPFPFLIILFPIYMAYLSGEGLKYLLWYDVKDGGDFRLYNKDNPPLPDKRKAIKLAFFLPFGFHNIYRGKTVWGRIQWGIFIFPLLLVLTDFFIPNIFILWSSGFIILFLAIMLIPIVINWIEGLFLLKS